MVSRPNWVRIQEKFCSPLAARGLPKIINFNANARATPTSEQVTVISADHGLSKKRKQHLSSITNRSLESRKQRKVNNEIQRKKEILRRQREQEDYWNEYEDYSLDSSSDESDCDEPSLDSLSFDDEREAVMEDSGKEKGTREGLGDDEGGGLLEEYKRILKPVWKKAAGSYLRGVRGCGSSAKENREIRRKKELEKSASQTRSIVDMFLAQQDKRHSPSQPTFSAPNPSSFMVKKVETKFELRVQAAHDLGELLHLKTQQIEKYGQELSPKSNYYCRHQMVRSFLWMQLNKKKDNPYLNRR